MSHKERLIESRAAKYFYEDIKIHCIIDQWFNIPLAADFKLVTWEKADALTKSVYKTFSKQQLIKEGIIKD